MTQRYVWPAIVLLLVVAPWDAYGAPICVAVGAAGGEQGETLAEFLRLWPGVAAREGFDAAVSRVDDTAVCPPEATLHLVVWDDRALVAAADGATFSRALGGGEPWDRARSLVSEAVEALRASSGRPEAFAVPEPAVPEPVGAAPSRRWGASIGGGYGYYGSPGPHRAGLELTVDLPSFSDRLIVSARLGWSPSQALSGAPLETVWSALDLGVAFAGGVPLGPVELRVGASVGARRRHIESTTWTRADGPSAEEWRLLVGAEGVLEWSLWRPFRVLLSVGAQSVPGATTWTWRGAALARAPAVVGTAAVRVGWWFE